MQVALAIAMSGARLDLGQADAALGELQIAQLDPQRAFVWSPALFDAYATVLEELGREEEAEQWWQRSDRATIALEQAAIPEGEDTVEIIEEFLEPEPGPQVAPEPAADEAESGTRTVSDAGTPLDGVDLVLADLDGVVYTGENAIPMPSRRSTPRSRPGASAT